MSQVINIRGSSCAGKTTLVLKLMESLSDIKNIKIDKFSVTRGELYNKKISILGRYDRSKVHGGIDTIPDLDKVIELIEHEIANGMDIIICEGGFILNRDKQKILKFKENLVILYLNTPVNICAKSHSERKKHRVVGDIDDFLELSNNNVLPKSFQSDWKAIDSTVNTLKELKINVVEANRNDAHAVLLNLIGNKND